MIPDEILKELVEKEKTKIVFYVIDGLGGIPVLQKGGTELEVAKTPNLDKLASRSLTGLVDPVAPGVTPGSGSGHLGIFGYDPFRYQIGRGILSALGVGFELQNNDVAARLNFATADKDGIIVDRRAGRIPDEENKRLCQIVLENVKLGMPEVKYFLQTEKEHRAVLVFRGGDLGDKVNDTDPLVTGRKTIPPEGLDEPSKRTAECLSEFLQKSHEVLTKTGSKANIFLARGIAKHTRFPSFQERYKLQALAIADYPMYRGLARLLGMDVERVFKSLKEAVSILKDNYNKYDFFYLHHKKPDSKGEDGNFDEKVKALEIADEVIPEIMELDPDVLIVTGDHATPSPLKAHSWHPCPILLYSKTTPGGWVKRFDERSCAGGELGRMLGMDIMPVALSHAKRLTKFGA
jgi:2,3-bisphosphoglycerate-independent phosphoglycerate mutase